MNNRWKNAIYSVIILISNELYGQPLVQEALVYTPKKWEVVISIGSGTGLGNTHLGRTVVENNGNLSQLKLGVMHAFKPKHAIHFNWGFDSYIEPKLLLMPLGMDYLYFFKGKQKTLFTGVGLYLIPKPGEIFDSGYKSKAFVGLRLGKRHNKYIKAGMDLHRINETDVSLIGPNGFSTVRDSFTLKSFVLSLGFGF
jgi:hypothetical protein